MPKNKKNVGWVPYLNPPFFQPSGVDSVYETTSFEQQMVSALEPTN